MSSVTLGPSPLARPKGTSTKTSPLETTRPVLRTPDTHQEGSLQGGLNPKWGRFPICPEMSRFVPACPCLSLLVPARPCLSFCPSWGPERGQIGANEDKRGQNGTFRDKLGNTPFRIHPHLALLEQHPLADQHQRRPSSITPKWPPLPSIQFHRPAMLCFVVEWS